MARSGMRPLRTTMAWAGARGSWTTSHTPARRMAHKKAPASTTRSERQMIRRYLRRIARWMFPTPAGGEAGRSSVRLAVILAQAFHPRGFLVLLPARLDSIANYSAAFHNLRNGKDATG